MEKKKELEDIINDFPDTTSQVVEYEWLKSAIYKAYELGKEDNLCGKPHNNGEDTCLECEMIKHGE